MFSDCNEIKLEINGNKISRKSPNTCKLNIILLNTPPWSKNSPATITEIEFLISVYGVR